MQVSILWGYTDGMKTAVSLPDELFVEADRLAKRLKKSRSQLYQEAVQEYLWRHSVEHVVEGLNRVCETIDVQSEPLVSAAAKKRLLDVEW